MKKLLSRDIKMPKDAGWLLPGLQVKRWFAMIFFGSLLILLGTMIIFNMRPIFYTMEFIRKIAMSINTGVVGVIVLTVGAYVFFKGWQKTNLSMLDLNNGREKETMLEALYRRRKLNNSLKVDKTFFLHLFGDT